MKLFAVFEGTGTEPSLWAVCDSREKAEELKIRLPTWAENEIKELQLNTPIYDIRPWP